MSKADQDCYKNAFKFKLEMFDLWFRTSLEEFPEIKIKRVTKLETYVKSNDFYYFLSDEDDRIFSIRFSFKYNSYKTLSEFDLYNFPMCGVKRYITTSWKFTSAEKFFEMLRMVKKVQKN
jgi:hypothetical protein